MEFLKKLRAFIWSKHFLKHAGLILLANFVIIFIVIYILDFTTNHGEKIKVPNLHGQNVKNIQSTLDELGLTYEILDSVYYPNKPEGTIVSQDPRPTDSTDVFVKSGRIIKIRVSKKNNMVEMPSLLDKSERFAQSVLKNRGLKYQIQYKPTSEADGAVLEQKYKGRDIEEGARVPVGATILLIVGRNEAGAPVQIPNLLGLTISEVKVRLASMSSVNLFETYLNCANGADSSAARVSSQSPEFIEGVLSPSNTTVTIQLDKNYTGNPPEGGL